MDKLWKYANWRKPDTKGYQTINHSHEISIMGKSLEKADWWLSGAGGGRNIEWLLSGYRVSILGNEKVLEPDSGDGCTTSVNVVNATELHFKMITMLNFILWVLHHSKNKTQEWRIICVLAVSNTEIVPDGTSMKEPKDLLCY